MPTFLNDNLKLHYEEIGAGDSLLCVHGATGAGSYEWDTLAAALSDRWRLVIPDLRSHGKSDHQAGAVGIEFVIDDLRALIAARELGRPHVMGFSFGAEVALDLELTRPGTCRSLILLSPGLGDPKSSVPSRERLEATWPRSLRQLHEERHGEDHWLEVMLELCARAAVRPKADLNEIAGIACPVLLVAGSKDDPRRIRQARVMEEHHRLSQLVVIEEAAHAVHKARPEEVAQEIRHFLEECEQTLGEPSGTKN
jgi:pimeloyl-ACP methyl ester carboxylesterase